jgi:hypothetical protein
MRTQFPCKCVDWSYPSSANAAKFGFPEGCYTVSFTKRTQSGECLETIAIAAFLTEGEANAAADSMPEPWAPWAKQAA